MPTLDFNVVIAILTSLGAVALVIWRGGIQVGKVEAIIQRLEGFETRLHILNELDTKVATLERSFEHYRSDHRELKGRIDTIENREWSRNETTGRHIFPPPDDTKR
jgi:hypothetical protein